MYTAKQIVPFWLRISLDFTLFYAATAQQIVRFRKESLASLEQRRNLLQIKCSFSVFFPFVVRPKAFSEREKWEKFQKSAKWPRLTIFGQIEIDYQ